MQENVPIYLITRYLSGEATTEESEALEIWLQQSPENLTLFKEHETLWASVRASERFKLEKGLDRINERIDSYEKSLSQNKSTSPFILYKVAASLIAVGLVAFLIFGHSYTSQTEKEITWTQLKTPAGHHQQIVLSDSSHVQINGLSKLYYPLTFQGNSREVHLTGEAYFKIASDKQHPFIIHTGNFTTQVVGTAFNIRSDSASVVVSVTEGVVKVFSNQDTMMLHPGEEVIYTSNKNKLLKSKADLEAALAWMSKSLILQNESLNVVAAKIFQLYGFTSEFQNERLKTIRITGKFRKMSLEDILHTIEFSTGTKIKVNNKHILWSDAN